MLIPIASFFSEGYTCEMIPSFARSISFITSQSSLITSASMENLSSSMSYPSSIVCFKMALFVRYLSNCACILLTVDFAVYDAFIFCSFSLHNTCACAILLVNKNTIKNTETAHILMTLSDFIISPLLSISTLLNTPSVHWLCDNCLSPC